MTVYDCRPDTRFLDLHFSPQFSVLPRLTSDITTVPDKLFTVSDI